MTFDSLECSICLQNFIHPAQLPCGHIFCFLCIKGCAFHRRKCPMCRSRFSSRFFDDPKLVNVWDTRQNDQQKENQIVDLCQRLSTLPQSVTASDSDKSSNYAWFYEGFRGWWQYDERTCNELENAFNKQLPSHEMTIAGYIYIVDLENMTQIRKDRSGRLRRIKRDLVNCEKKGVAGIKLSAIQSSNSDTLSAYKHSRVQSATHSNPNATDCPMGNHSASVSHFQPSNNESLEMTQKLRKLSAQVDHAHHIHLKMNLF
uniref:E3 ubiquitin-protein ligase n=1 Tax=Schistosoma japonicum TaxID=6182 RepID=Q86ET4_SCHJA|nr:similar to GenBank Accession Number AY070592 RE69393p in Drosophila melanogaster [Schistosoma japonicum]